MTTPTPQPAYVPVTRLGWTRAHAITLNHYNRTDRDRLTVKVLCGKETPRRALRRHNPQAPELGVRGVCHTCQRVLTERGGVWQ